MSSTQKEERVAVNISLTQEEKTTLKIYAAKQGKTVSAVIQDYIATLRKEEEQNAGKVH